MCGCVRVFEGACLTALVLVLAYVCTTNRPVARHPPPVCRDCRELPRLPPNTLTQDPSLLSQEQINQMLLVFVDGMTADKPVEIQQVAAQGMVHALSFASENFTDKNALQRDMIMSAICNATQLPDVKVVCGVGAARAGEGWLVCA